MNTDRTRRHVEELWDDSIVPELVEYIRIPNKSPHFDPDWAEHGYMDDAVAHMVRWCEAHPIPGMQLEVVRLPGRTPLIFIEVPGEGDDCLLLYGHLDKQPEMSGWRDGLGPWTPKLEGDRLYGRGGADDGYAIYASLAALGALHEQGIPHARCVVIIEACEESGSYDLPHYIEALRPRIGTPSLVVCLDSGCGDYERLWCTTSLRGFAGGTLEVEVLREGVHSGDAGGVVPSTFRILRALLSRLEDERDGRILVDALHVQIPPPRRQQARETAAVLGERIHAHFPFVAGAGPTTTDPVELVLNRTWRPALEITGAAGAARDRKRGQRGPPPHRRQALDAAPANLRFAGRSEHDAHGPGARPASRGAGALLGRAGGVGLGGTAGRSVARPCGAPGLQDLVRPGSGVHGRRRLHPLHGDARRAVPAGAVPHHRSPRSRIQCPRAERVPAHPHRKTRHLLRGGSHRRSSRPRGEFLSASGRPRWAPLRRRAGPRRGLPG